MRSIGISNIYINMKNAIYLFCIYVMLLLNYYYVISELFAYAGFSKEYFHSFKLLLGILTTLLLILLTMFFKNHFYKLMYSIILILFYFGQSIFYVYNNSSYQLVFYVTIPLIMIFIVDRIDTNNTFKRRTINLNDKVTRYVIIIVVIILLVPYLRFINTVNLQNLLLIDIYETRALLQDYNRGISGYLFSPITRIILPILLVYGIAKKNMLLSGLALISIIGMFLLNGAVKSIFFGIICALFFIKGSYIFKETRFLKLLLLINIVALVSFIFWGSYTFNDYLRRIFFVPAFLFNTYFNYFDNNFTYFSHSKLYSLFAESEWELPISLFIGEYVIGQKGLNANTGIIVEGFLSFGTLGVVVFSLFLLFFLIFIKKMNFDERYFGVFFVYIYVLNTSFIESLLISHGLIFLLIFSIYFIPKKEKLLE